MSVQGMQATVLLTLLGEALRMDGWTMEVPCGPANTFRMSDDVTESPALVELVRQIVEQGRNN